MQENLSFWCTQTLHWLQTKMSWESIGIKVMVTEHRASGDSKNRTAPQGTKSQDWTWAVTAPTGHSPAVCNQGRGDDSNRSVDSPALIRESEVWSVWEYRQKPWTGLVLPTVWLGQECGQDLGWNGASGPQVERRGSQMRLVRARSALRAMTEGLYSCLLLHT